MVLLDFIKLKREGVTLHSYFFAPPPEGGACALTSDIMGPPTAMVRFHWPVLPARPD